MHLARRRPPGAQGIQEFLECTREGLGSLREVSHRHRRTDLAFEVAAVDRRRILAVPDRRAACAVDAPRTVPRGLEPLAAPTPVVDVTHVAFELEDGRRRGVSSVPAPSRVRRHAVHAHRVSSQQIAGSVEGMDGHVDEQWLVHLVTETPEARRERKLGAHRPDPTQTGYLVTERGDAVVVTARLADHQQTSSRLRRRRERECFGDGRRDGLLAQHGQAA